MSETPIELENYWRDLEETFGTAGWRRLIEIWDSELELLKEQGMSCANAKELFFLRGQYATLERLQGLPNALELAKQNYLEEQRIEEEEDQYDAHL